MEEQLSATCKCNKRYKLANDILRHPNVEKTMKMTRNNSDVWSNNFLLLTNVKNVTKWQISACGFKM